MSEDNGEEEAQKRLAYRKHQYDLVLAMINATTAFEREALGPRLILNGGALIVFIALFGAIITSFRKIDISFDLAFSAIGVWALGLVCGAVASGCGYYSQFSFRKMRGQEVRRDELREKGNEDDAKAEARSATDSYDAGQNSRKWAYRCFVVSILSFIGGVFLALLSIICSGLT